MGNSTDPVADVHDEWSIATVEVPVPERYLRREATLLVELPCPPPRAEPLPLSDFECEVLETAEHARYCSLTPRSLRRRARRCGWCASVAVMLAAAAVPFPTVIWIGVVPIAVAAGLGWQWAVLGATARRLDSERTRR
jgi:hypothetical protein